MGIQVEENPDYTLEAKPKVAKFRRAMPPTFTVSPLSPQSPPKLRLSCGGEYTRKTGSPESWDAAESRRT